MALLNIEGFEGISSGTGSASNQETADWMTGSDYYDTGQLGSGGNPLPQIYGGWVSGDSISLGDDGNAINNHLSKFTGLRSTLIVGLAVKPSNVAENAAEGFLKFASMTDDVDEFVEFSIKDGRHLKINNNSAFLGIIDNAFWKDAFTYVEVKVTFHSTAGVIVVRLNGVEVFNETGLDTVTGTQTEADQVTVMGRDGSTNSNPSSQHLYDDWYICDTLGGVNDDFLGPLKVETLFPDGAGDSTQFTPSAGSNFQNVDEVEIDGDTTYNESSTTAHLDLFTADNLTNIDGTIYGVQLDVRANSTAAQVFGCIPTVKRSTTEGAGTATYMSDSYLFQECGSVFEQDPAAGPGAWTVTNINAMQIGYEVA